MRWEITGHPTDPALAWRRLGDSDWMNRVAGNGAMTVQVRVTPSGEVRHHGTVRGLLGVQGTYEEVAGGWVRGRWFRQERRYSSFPIKESRFELRLEPRGEAVVPVISLELVPAHAALGLLLRVRMPQLRRAWQELLDGLPPPGQPPRPAMSRRLSREAEEAIQRWAEVASPEVVALTRALMLEGRVIELQKLRPFELADRWGLDREEVLIAMIRGVPVGALELYWSVLCTRCRGQVAAVSMLSDLADHASCPSCQLDFESNLSDNVEVRFAPHPAVVPGATESFCSVYPSGAPDIAVSVVLAPGERLQERLVLPEGAWRLGAGDLPELRVQCGPRGGDVLTWPAGQVEQVAVRAGEVSLALENTRDVACRYLLVRADPSETAVPAALLTTMAECRRELGEQVVAADVRVGNRSVALLFTDLSGSTAMYCALGDAEAFALVRDHFRVLRGVVEAHGGVVVKTIGDAVMASFHSVHRAFDAALAMQEAFARFVEAREMEEPPKLNVGLHVGPALIVHTDSAGMDYFGTTVNLAARAQGAATEGAFVFTAAVAKDALIQDRLAQLGLTPEPFEKELKGLGAQPLFRLDLRRRAPCRETRPPLTGSPA